MASDKIMACAPLVKAKGLKIAFVESATAGWLASEFSLVPDSGKILVGGIIVYDADAKTEMFGISKETIEQYTAKSAEVTKLLADGLGRYFKCDIAVAITGLTTPGGSETPEKPVGTIFIQILLQGRHYPYREVFTGPAEDIIKQTIDKVGIHLSSL
ncbi:MAG: nicotinamide-nucleotide amidohydrolase family protein, partial [Flavobacterium sp.]